MLEADGIVVGGVAVGGIAVGEIVVGGNLAGDATWTLLEEGGINGTFSGGMILEDAGVAGVGALPGAILTAPGGGGMVDEAVVLCDPGKTGRSELRVEESLDLGGLFCASEKER